MKVLHSLYSYLPDPPGGTEIYVQDLCRQLRLLGVDSAVVAPGAEATQYYVENTKVYRILTNTAPALIDLYGRGDSRSADAFAAIVDAEAPDVVHQHALTPTCSVEWAQRTKRAAKPLVVTMHSPTVSCARGTLMRWGTTPCDGRLDAVTCSACAMQGRGVPRAASEVLARIPASLGKAVGRAGLTGRAWTAVQMPGLIAEHHEHVRDFFGLADAIVSLSPWVRRLLELNDVPPAKIVDVRHGTPDAVTPAGSRPEDGTLRIAHLGRLDPTKGTTLLVDAVRRAPSNITLDVFGVVQDPTHAATGRDAELRRGSDVRIRFHRPLDHSAVVPALATFDLVAVPSQWMETGPLVVLEAFAAGVPVIGSALGGLADKIRHGVDGLLVSPPDSVDAWASTLARCAADSALVRTLSRGVRRPRSSADVAREMCSVYTSLTGAMAMPLRTTRPSAHAS